MGHCDPEPSSDFEPVPHLVRAALAFVEPGDLGAPILGELGRLVPEEAARLPAPSPIHDPSTGRRLPHDNLWLGATALYAGVAASTGDAAQRALLRCSLAPFADQWCVFGAGGAAFGTGRHWLGQLAVADGDFEAGRAHLTPRSTSPRTRVPTTGPRSRRTARRGQLALITPGDLAVPFECGLPVSTRAFFAATPCLIPALSAAPRVATAAYESRPDHPARPGDVDIGPVRREACRP